jgi:hypothetical protein
MMRASKHFLCPVPTASKKEWCFFSQIFAFPLKKRKFEKKNARALLSRRLAQNAYRAGRLTGRRALSACGKDNGPALRQ